MCRIASYFRSKLWRKPAADESKPLAAHSFFASNREVDEYRHQHSWSRDWAIIAFGPCVWVWPYYIKTTLWNILPLRRAGEIPCTCLAFVQFLRTSRISVQDADQLTGLRSVQVLAMKLVPTMPTLRNVLRPELQRDGRTRTIFVPIYFIREPSIYYILFFNGAVKKIQDLSLKEYAPKFIDVLILEKALFVPNLWNLASESVHEWSCLADFNGRVNKQTIIFSTKLKLVGPLNLKSQL